MLHKDIRTSLARLRSLARLNKKEIVREELGKARPEDLADTFQRLSTEDALTLLKLLDDETASNVLIEMPTEQARRMVSELPDRTLAHYLDILPMDDALDLCEELGEERFEILLEVIPKEDASELRRLMAYPKNSIGRLMTENFAWVEQETAIAQLLDEIREANEDKYETVSEIYVLDEHRHLLGVFSLREAIRAMPEQIASEVMKTDIVSCQTTDSAEEAARQIARYGLYAIPVLDDRGHMLGIVTVDDAQSILRQADTEDVLKLGGVSGDAESYLSLGVMQIARRRLPWLLGLFVAETLTGSVLRHYGQLDDATVALSPVTYFIPLLIGAGGNSGSQTTTTITRALAVGDVKTSDALYVLKKEFSTAVIIGAVLGLMGFCRALLWGTDVTLSMVVGLALPLIVVWATTIGSVLPLGAKRIGVDPAVMSAPFIATFVDATGLVIYFELVRHILGGMKS